MIDEKVKVVEIETDGDGEVITPVQPVVNVNYRERQIMKAFCELNRAGKGEKALSSTIPLVANYTTNPEGFRKNFVEMRRSFIDAHERMIGAVAAESSFANLVEDACENLRIALEQPEEVDEETLEVVKNSVKAAIEYGEQELLDSFDKTVLALNKVTTLESALMDDSLEALGKMGYTIDRCNLWKQMLAEFSKIGDDPLSQAMLAVGALIPTYRTVSVGTKVLKATFQASAVMAGILEQRAESCVALLEGFNNGLNHFSSFVSSQRAHCFSATNKLKAMNRILNNQKQNPLKGTQQQKMAISSTERLTKALAGLEEERKLLLTAGD